MTIPWRSKTTHDWYGIPWLFYGFPWSSLNSMTFQDAQRDLQHYTTHLASDKLNRCCDSLRLVVSDESSRVVAGWDMSIVVVREAGVLLPPDHLVAELTRHALIGKLPAYSRVPGDTETKPKCLVGAGRVASIFQLLYVITTLQIGSF